MKILIVDDSSVMRKLVLRGLRQAGHGGHDFEEAKDGKEALEKATASAPDLILCDWNMPEMNGIELFEALKEAEIQTRFCFVTSESSAEMRTRASEAGVDAFLSKPFTGEALEEALGAFLN